MVVVDLLKVLIYYQYQLKMIKNICYNYIGDNMAKIVEIENNKYEIIKDYRDGYDKDEFISKCTDYFYDFDYVVGDWAYDKLRLKGFYEDSNPKSKNINKISMLDDYIKNNCAYDCKYFVAKKINI